MEKERHVLVIFPHPDDEAFGVSGTIASYVESGTPVTYVCLTLGEMGRNLGNPPFATRESLPKIRRQELLNAAEVMGIQDLRMLGLRDKTVEFEDDEELTNKMSSFIDELNPSLIITFYPGYSVHPDHEATGRAVVRAVERIAPDARPKLHCVAFANNSLQELGEPNIINDISAVKDKKIATMKAHRSQTEAMMASWSENAENPDPAILAWIEKERFWTYKWPKP
ncbi:bacillithiol biosynthesis deacetylase BshB2 [Bacillus sp. V5-8f]|uniref:bacillithiol biosynthesis deacetylase BshB2 n=1 Tax=Bacillus sp. V5-8f TaxID=2053044 RepID=UPI000C7592B2|nr:bacillithiol biosynthesis deacetylase BshB2 [Bacillus sp. V5-8f]PLT35929.1 bacillithiol biosynthesis deacetylase BshB2 [Bacillus sp. V5-8f]